MENHHWLPNAISALPLCQLQALFDPGSRPRELTAAEQLALINQKRALKGLPPIQSRRKQRHGD